MNNEGRYWDKSWNPTTGCTKISEGCQHCWAAVMARRFPKSCAGDFAPRMHLERLAQPLHWRKPRVVFVSILGDLFHEKVPDDFRDQIFAVMALCPKHTFMVLTKRIQNGLHYLDLSTDNREESIGQQMIEMSGGKHAGLVELPFANIWLGVTAENQARADERIPLLLQTPAALHFVSCEPLLEPISLSSFILHPSSLDWVVCGAETGPAARPCNPDWVRSLRDQCAAANVPFFLKSLGPGKGRILDGRTHDAKPF